MTSNFSVKDLPLEYSDALLSSSNFYLQDKMAMQEHEMRGGVLPFQLNLNLNNTYTEILFQLIPPLSLIWDRLPPHDKDALLQSGLLIVWSRQQAWARGNVDNLSRESCARGRSFGKWHRF